MPNSEREPGPYWARFFNADRMVLVSLAPDGRVYTPSGVQLFKGGIQEWGPRITREDAEELVKLRAACGELHQLCSDGMDDELDLHKQLSEALTENEALRARVAELEGMLHHTTCVLEEERAVGEVLRDYDKVIIANRAFLSQPSADSPPHDDGGGKADE